MEDKTIHLPQYYSALIGDIAGAFDVFGGSVAGIAVQNLFKIRLSAAREILLLEISAGEKDIWEACEVDEVAAIVYRYMRAAQEGTARTNLRLLARIIAGQKAAKVLRADEFLYYADIIDSLRYEEIIVLGKLHKSFNEQIEKEKANQLDTKEISRAATEAYRRTQKETIESGVFSTEDEYVATCGALVRTGLVWGTGMETYTSWTQSRCHEGNVSSFWQ